MPLGFGGVLFVVFLVLKLTHNIDWSWWWVSAPLWVGAALTVAIFVLIGGAAGFVALFTRRSRRRA